MRKNPIFCILWKVTTILSILAPQKIDAQSRVGGTPVGTILERLDAKLEKGVTFDQLSSYSRQFGFVDHDSDGRHSKLEYVEKGNYLTPQSRRGIFNAADHDGDGFVTKAEYILNRIITDEAKAIVQSMDDDKDGVIQRAEFIKNTTGKLSDATLARQVFGALDTNNNGEILVPEYLRVWGKWARTGNEPAEQRIAARENELRNSSQDGVGASRQGRDGRPGGPPSGLRGPRSGPPSVAEIFERFDANKDGKLQKSEIPDFSQQFILPADTNNDDVITKEELEKSRTNRQGGPPRRGGRRGPGRGFGGPPGRGGSSFGPFSGNTDPVRLNRAGLEVGSQLPEVTIFDADGNEFETASMKGGYSVLVFGCLT